MEGTPPSSRSNHSGEIQSHELQPVKSIGKEQEKMEDFSIFDMVKQPYYTKISSGLSQRFVEKSAHTIHRVHGSLRNISYKAYEPEIIAIGPYHRDKDNLKMMEDHKWHYLSLICQGKKENFDKFCLAIKPLEPKARNCYADSISLNEDEFVRMLVLDGCFIIELVRKVMRNEYDSVTRLDWILISLRRDLMLFENQIPFFVLRKLSELMIESPNQDNWLLYLFGEFFIGIIRPTEFSNRSPDEDSESPVGLLTRFFRSICHVKENRENSNKSPDEGGGSPDRSRYEIKHLLHLIRNELVSSFELDLEKRMNYTRKKLTNIKSATWLAEANVKFKRNKVARSLLDIKFERGTLLIPPLRIDDGMEPLFRNLIAYEQYFCDTQCTHSKDRYKCITDYVLFLDCLIDFSRDVEILSHFDIIENSLGNNEEAAEIFNKLTGITDYDFIYGEIFDKLEEHCSKRWNRWVARRNRWMANLRMNYFNSPWAIISFIAAVVLLLLTVAQTVLSALSL